jgi:hypothetical protein
MMVQAFCNNNDFTVDLPELGSWVGVRVTAVLNPGHFWVQFPCGSGPIERKIMEGIALNFFFTYCELNSLRHLESNQVFQFEAQNALFVKKSKFPSHFHYLLSK